jgi:hypothetical protein
MIGKIPGKANVKGDSEKNDTVQINVSPGEIVIPRTVVQKGPSAILKFAREALEKDQKNFSEGGKVKEQSVWDKFATAFDEEKPKKKTPVPGLDREKAKSFSSVFNNDNYAHGGVVRDDGLIDLSHELQPEKVRDDGLIDLSHELRTGEGWEVQPEPKKKESRAAEAALQGFGNAASFGYLPQLNAIAEPLYAGAIELASKSDTLAEMLDIPKDVEIDTGDYVKRRDEAAKYQRDLANAEPGAYVAGALGGGLASGIATGGGVAGATSKFLPQLGGAAGRILNAGATGAVVGAASNPGETEGEWSPVQPVDRAINAVTGGVLGAGIQTGGEAVYKAVAPTAKRVAEIVKPKLRDGWEEIKRTAEALGIKVTPGMLSEKGSFVQRMEDSLQKSPSMIGRHVGKQRSAVQDTLNDEAGGLLSEATELTPFQVGENVKTGIGKSIDTKAAPLSKVFDEAAESTKHIPISEKSINAITRNIEADDLVRMGVSKKTAGIIRKIQSLKNANDVKTLRTIVRAEAQGAEGADRIVLGQIDERLANLEKNSTMRAAIQSAKEGASKNEFAQLAAEDEGKAIAMQIVGDLRGARKGWRGLHEEMQGTGISSKGGPSAYKERLDAIPSQNIQDKLFNPQRLEVVDSLKKNFPEQFEPLKAGKLREILDRSLYKGDLSAQRFVREISKFDPEFQKHLLGDQVDKVKQITTLVNAIPENFNPSGTASASSFTDALYQNFKDIPNFLLYKGASSQGLRDSASKGVQKIANFSEALTKVPNQVGAVAGSMVNPVKPFDRVPTPIEQMNPKYLDILGKNPELIEKIENPKLREAVMKHFESNKSVDRDPRQSFLEGN